MWYVANFIRGMTIDEAIRQLNFCKKKGASFVRDTLLEAQQMAIREHNVEFKTNLWVGQYLIALDCYERLGSMCCHNIRLF